MSTSEKMNPREYLDQINNSGPLPTATPTGSSGRQGGGQFTPPLTVSFADKVTTLVLRQVAAICRTARAQMPGKPSISALSKKAGLSPHRGAILEDALTVKDATVGEVVRYLQECGYTLDFTLAPIETGAGQDEGGTITS